MSTERVFLALGAALGLVAVAAGAFGAHWLRQRVPGDAVAVFETAARYQMYHALALLGTGTLIARAPSPLLHWSGWLFVTGTIIFCGSLYLLTFTGARWLGAVTPIGGLAFLAGWACLLGGVLSR